MKTAILYARVSSDEQATKYSLSVQQEELQKYCQKLDIQVLKVFVEDESAKNFNRPEYKLLEKYARTNKKKIDFLLVTKWNRFSRSISLGYQKLDYFMDSLNIEVNAIQQYIDFEIPEQRIMLSVYLAEGEVNNRRRSIDIRGGIRKAKKSGRYTSRAPRGYDNKRDENLKPILVQNEDAKFIKAGFELIASQGYSAEKARLTISKKGKHFAHSMWYEMLRNPLYMGKIYVPAFKDEPSELVEGLHKAIVSESTFYRVQQIMDGKNSSKINQPKKYSHCDELPLRGFIKCPKCKHKMTGSGSKGRNGRFYYYFCFQKGCKIRLKALEINEYFEKHLDKIKVNKSAKKLYTEVLSQYFRGNSEDRRGQILNITKEINSLNERLERLQDKFADDLIDREDYSEMKSRYKVRIADLEEEKKEIDEIKEGFESRLKEGIHMLGRIKEYYRECDVLGKQKLITALYGSNSKGVLMWDGCRFRTAKINKAVELICRIDKGLGGKEIGDNIFASDMVENIGVEPMTSTLPA